MGFEKEEPTHFARTMSPCNIVIKFMRSFEVKISELEIMWQQSVGREGVNLTAKVIQPIGRKKRGESGCVVQRGGR